MLRDVATVIWKEWKEFLSQRGTLAGMAIFLAIFAVLLPYQRGRAWVESPLGLLNLVLLPLFLVLTVIADAFAGERERHTLETLLASRLSDQAILFGKLAAAAAYGWGQTVAALALSLASASVAAGEVLHYSWRTALGAGGLSLLGIVLVAAAGILGSLRAATVRQAQQTLNIGLLLIGLIPVGVAALLPAAWRERVRDAVVDGDATRLLLLAALALLVADAAAIGATLARFRRSRLVLD